MLFRWQSRKGNKKRGVNVPASDHVGYGVDSGQAAVRERERGKLGSRSLGKGVERGWDGLAGCLLRLLFQLKFAYCKMLFCFQFFLLVGYFEEFPDFLQIVLFKWSMLCVRECVCVCVCVRMVCECVHEPRLQHCDVQKYFVNLCNKVAKYFARRTTESGNSAAHASWPGHFEELLAISPLYPHVTTQPELQSGPKKPYNHNENQLKQTVYGAINFIINN